MSRHLCWRDSDGGPLWSKPGPGGRGPGAGGTACPPLWGHCRQSGRKGLHKQHLNFQYYPWCHYKFFPSNLRDNEYKILIVWKLRDTLNSLLTNYWWHPPQNRSPRIHLWELTLKWEASSPWLMESFVKLLSISFGIFYNLLYFLRNWVPIVTHTVTSLLFFYPSVCSCHFNIVVKITYSYLWAHWILKSESLGEYIIQNTHFIEKKGETERGRGIPQDYRLQGRDPSTAVQPWPGPPPPSCCDSTWVPAHTWVPGQGSACPSLSSAGPRHFPQRRWDPVVQEKVLTGRTVVPPSCSKSN